MSDESNNENEDGLEDDLLDIDDGELRGWRYFWQRIKDDPLSYRILKIEAGIAIVLGVLLIIGWVWLWFFAKNSPDEQSPTEAPTNQLVINTPTSAPTEVASGVGVDDLGEEPTDSATTLSQSEPAINQVRGLIDEHINEIEVFLDEAITDAWMEPVGNKLRERLSQFNITMADEDTITALGLPLFQMADDQILWTAWQAEKFNCEKHILHDYRCVMLGDWGNQPALTAVQWESQLRQMRDVIANQWHGASGSEREITELAFRINMSADHNSGKLVLEQDNLVGY